MKASHAIAVAALALGTILVEPGGLFPGAGATAAAAGFYVSTGGSDNNPGTIDRPRRTIDFALGRLGPGDTLYVRAGTYFERVTATVSGTASSPIVVRSYPGERATLDSGTPAFRTTGNNDWELVDATLGEYRSRQPFESAKIYAYVAGIPGYENERVALVPYADAAPFRATTDLYVDATTPFYVGPGTFWDPADGRIHVRLAKTRDLRFAESRYGTVFAAENADPRQYSIILSQSSKTLTVEGAYLVFKDITVNQALNTVYLRASAHHVVFDGVTVWLGDSSFEVVGSHDVTITRSRVYGDASYWIFWSDMKDAPAPADRMRGTSIDLSSGAHDIEISYNHIRGCGQDLIGVKDAEYDVSVHHNRIENAGDDAFELEGTADVGRIWIHDNYILNCLVAVAPGQDTPTFTGPLYVYRNVIALLRNPPVNRKEGINTWNGGHRYGFEYMFKHGTSSSYNTRNTHYYHNTLVMLNHGGKGLNLTPKFPDDCRIVNNLAVMVNGVVNRDYRSAAGEVVDGNLYWKVNTVDSDPLLSSYQTVPAFSSATGFEIRGIGSEPRRGTDPLFAGLRLQVVDRSRQRWELDRASESPALTDFVPSAQSPAIGAGITIPAHPQLGALPDSRTSRDIGALPHGISPDELRIFPFLPQAAADTVPPSRPAITVGRR